MVEYLSHISPEIDQILLITMNFILKSLLVFALDFYFASS